VVAKQVLYHLSHPQLFLLQLFFQIGCCVYSQAHLNHHPPIYASHLAGMIIVGHHAQLLLVGMRSHKYFARACLESQFFQSPPPEELGLQV
jgi:hypothetical protein